MVDLKELRESPEKYRRGAELKGVRVDIDAILRTDEKSRMAQRLADELLAAYRKEGKAMNTREQTHRMADANKAFAHFAW